MRSQLLLGAFTLTGVLALPGVAFAQGSPPAGDGPVTSADEGPPFRTSNDQVNEDLDRSLRQEFDEDHPPPPDVAPAAPAVVDPDDDDRLRLRLGGLAAHYYSQLQDVRLSYREGTSGGEDIDVDEDDAIADFEPANTQLYRAWFDIGKHVGFYGGFWRGVFRDQKTTTQQFTFGRMTFLEGEDVSTRVELMTADLDLVVKPVNVRVFKSAVPGRTERSRLEAALPVVGASLALRPARWFEIFARGRVGYLSYDRPQSTRIHDGDVDTIDAKEKEAKTVEIDVGLKFIFADTIGLIAGYRLDHLRIEREVDDRTEGVRGTAHGVYAGLILDF
jgi:hypothetical protein